MTHRVTFYDLEDADSLIEWALDHCISFDSNVTTDISDISLCYDTAHDFYFGTESDAIWFKLRWS